MISVLIPTYNYVCYPLVADLQRQLEQSGEEYEVIVFDDGSRSRVTIIANLKINELPHCHYTVNEENVGRARILNLLCQQAKGEWCLLMDSDAKVVSLDFISCYLDAVKQQPDLDIVVGGLVNPPTLPSPEVTLRYRYEKKYERFRSAAYRNRNPFKKFGTFNVMIRRSVLLETPFDARCTEYGYEDTLMGVELERKGKKILHIDNPLMHLGFDRNAVYLKKIETSLHILSHLGDSLLPETGIGKAIAWLDKWHLRRLYTLAFKVAKPIIRRNLLGRNPSIKLFNIYKLGYFLTL